MPNELVCWGCKNSKMWIFNNKKGKSASFCSMRSFLTCVVISCRGFKPTQSYVSYRQRSQLIGDRNIKFIEVVIKLNLESINWSNMQKILNIQILWKSFCFLSKTGAKASKDWCPFLGSDTCIYYSNIHYRIPCTMYTKYCAIVSFYPKLSQSNCILFCLTAYTVPFTYKEYK